MFKDGIPATMFAVDDIDKQYDKLKEKGVQFKMAPTPMEEVKVAIFDDTCGNYIMLCER